MLSCLYHIDKMKTELIYLEQTDSTNRYLRENHLSSLIDEDKMVVVWTGYQTAGKGQGSNVWESERDENLLFSVLVHPVSVPVNKQFVLSMAIALAVKKTMDTYTDDITVKWPNDVYWRDNKISGTLIETTITSHGIRDCVFGTGIDINQKEFHCTATNPISLYGILGKETDPKCVLDDVVEKLKEYMTLINKGDYRDIRDEYMSSLYRSQGLFPYRDSEGPFRASIEDVEDDGHLLLRDTDHKIRRYAFKEVKYIIE